MKSFSVLLILLINVFIFSTSNAASKYSDLEIYKKVFSKNILKEIGQYLNKTNQFDTNECTRDIGIWFTSLISGKFLWPFQMADAWGKFPPGILTLNLHSYGQFDECIRIKYLDIKGKYCLGKVLLYPQNELKFLMDMEAKITPESKEHNTRMMNFDTDGHLFYVNALCFPHTCNTDEMQQYVEIVLRNNGIQQSGSLLTIPKNECTTNDPPIWTPTDWGALSFYIFFGLLILLSTIYDVFIDYFKKEHVRIHDLLISFSIWTNTAKLVKVNDNSFNLKCLRGLRGISILWVILGHRYTADSIIPVMNYIDFYNWLEYAGSAVILGGTYAVDTFFVISGLLVAYTTFNLVKLYRKSFHLPIFYLHRIVRLTPAFAAVVFFQVSLFKFLGTGPLWNKITEDVSDRCEKNWWTALLYVQNYVDPAYMCVAQTWYLCCDMQLFILSPIVIYPFLKTKKLGWPSIIFWILISEIGVFVLAYEYGWAGAVAAFAGIENRDKYFYFATHARATPWLIGFATGYFLYSSSKSKIKLNEIVVGVCWVICLGTLAAIIFGLIPLQRHDHVIGAGDIVYNTFSKLGWAICITWIVIACTYGYGGPINWFLSWNAWEILGKLSYAMYLVHPNVQYSYSATMRTPFYFKDYSTIHTFFSDIVLVSFIAYLLTISFEIPFINLEKLLLKKKITKSTSPKSPSKSINNIEDDFLHNSSRNFAQ